MSDTRRPQTDVSAPGAVLIDLKTSGVRSGVQWSHESDDLDLTLLAWTQDRGIAPHVNAEVDVVLIAVEGAGIVTVNGTAHPLTTGQALLIPKGCERAIAPAAEGFSYLSVHRRRRGLMPTMNFKPTFSNE